MSSRIRQAEKPYERSDLPDVAVGDSVAVAVKITEGDRERLQTFAGTVIRVRGGGLGKTFTVRRIVQGEGVERVFPWHSPVIAGIEITRKGRVRRSRLYYLRDRVGKATRLREVLGARGQLPQGPTGSEGADENAAPEPAEVDAYRRRAGSTRSGAVPAQGVAARPARARKERAPPCRPTPSLRSVRGDVAGRPPRPPHRPPR
jgi:large subunit ribosomal protein L19